MRLLRACAIELRTSLGNISSSVSTGVAQDVSDAARIASTCSPYLVNLAGPRPGILIKACSDPGFASAIAIRVASVNTQKAGTFSSAASCLRHSLSRLRVRSSYVAGQSVCRPSLRSAASCSA